MLFNHFIFYTSFYLRHLITFALPTQSLVVVWIGMCANIDGLPMSEVARTLAYVENAQLIGFIGGHPFLGLWHAVTTGADTLMEGYRFASAQIFLQLRFVAWHSCIGLHLEDREWEYPESIGNYRYEVGSTIYMQLPRRFALQICIVARNHLQKFLHQTRIWIQFNIGG